jgi:uncharacterized membrane protein
MSTQNIYRLVLSFFAIFFVAVRFWHLTDSCLWFDEIFSVHAAEHSWSGILPFVAKDLIHPPLFYILLKVWIGIGGESVFWLRSLSVLFAAGCLIPFFCLCRELNIKSLATAISLAFFAANGALIKYAQEVRMYSLLLCLSLLSIWLFARFFFRGKNIWILTFVNILLIYSHYFGWFIVLAEVFAILIFQRIKLRQIAHMLGATLLAFLPWIWMIWNAVGSGSDIDQNLGWIARPGLGDIFDLLANLVEPFYYQQSSIDPGTHLHISGPILIICGLGMILFYGRVGNSDEKARIRFLSVFLITPVVMAFILSWVLPVSVWGSRHLIILFAPAIILAAICISEITPKFIRNIAIGAVGLLFITAFVARVQSTEPKYVWCAWEELAPKIDKDGEQKLYVFEDLVAYHFWFATKNRSDLQIFKVNGVPEMTEDKAYFLPRGFDGVETINADEISGDRFWIAFRDMKWDARHPPLNVLIDRGYKIGQPEAIDAGGLQAFLVEVTR